MTTTNKRWLPPRNHPFGLLKPSVTGDVLGLLGQVIGHVCKESGDAELVREWIQKRREDYAATHPDWPATQTQAGAMLDLAAWHQKRTPEQVLRSLRLSWSLGNAPFTGHAQSFSKNGYRTR
jgi:hypothetical protein